MARYNDAVCRLCRREGQKLFLKGDRCYTEKCALERRAYARCLNRHRRTVRRHHCAHHRAFATAERLRLRGKVCGGRI